MFNKKNKLAKRITAWACMIAMCLGMVATNTGAVYAADGRKIDVWDFGCVAETDTATYNNNITEADITAWTELSDAGKYVVSEAAGTTKAFGDMTIQYYNNDRHFGSVKNYGTNSVSTTAFADGYTANGMYYANGTGGENRRYIQLDNVVAGDKVLLYLASSNGSTDTVYFEYLGTEEAATQSAEFSKAGAIGEFIAERSGSYKMWVSTAGGAKPCYHRVVRVPGAAVSGTINMGPCTATEYELKFVNDTTGKSYVATVTDGTFAVTVPAGYSYTAALSGATGFGFTNASKKFSVTDAESVTGKAGIALEVEAKSTYTYSGTITGFDSAYDVSGLKVTMMAPANSEFDNVPLSIASDLTFSATLEPDVEYTMELTGVNDYEITSSTTVNSNEDLAQDITVALKVKQSVTGNFVTLDGTLSQTVTALTFENVDDGYKYTATVNGAAYEVTLRAGSYLATATVDGFKTTTHVVVGGAAVAKDLLFVSTATPGALTKVSDIYVGYSEKDNNYDTVRAAVAAAARMNPTSEAERVTIHIAPGTYREQIIVKTPYISFVNDEPEKEVLLTWYYGIGYQYYSAATDGYYNDEDAFDKFDKRNVERWGCATRIEKTAKAFRAENITFEASFNRYITDEEIADGVELVAAPENCTAVRNYALDVTAKASTERAAALAVEAPQTEFYNCKMLGSQDTLYTGDGSVTSYYKNCFIEGNTDFIFGDGNLVFDNCELSIYGYSDTNKTYPAYLTAAKDTATLGYLFRNCAVTTNDKLNQGASYFGRPWGAAARVTFVNTKLETAAMITDAGWYDWNSTQTAANANYVEYNTTTLDGSAVNTTSRTAGTVVTTNPVSDVKTYFGSWTPEYYVEEAATVEFAVEPYVVSNGDINTPYPGNTFTVGYSLGEANDANDASVIKWYSVSASGETLVKTSTANVDKTYKLQSTDTGNKIKVVVVPTTASGNAGAGRGYTVVETVRDGYEDPSVTGPGAVLGDGVNIFLAGDSTVKDYSAAGMNSGGKARDEGAWGEFLQSFFNEDLVTIVNYANGGRSVRNFINEGSLDAIKANIGEGDYLLIQFGHNDSSNQSGYLEDRYVPLGEPDASGVYPATEATKVATPSSLVSKYGDTYYGYQSGTFKWYLKQYINVAREAGATPILVTPVSRLYYLADGTIKPHHDSTDATTGTQVTSNNAYVTAYEQLAEEEGVLLLDGFEITKTMYEAAYAADPTATAGTSVYGSQVMYAGDKTHNNKLGGFLIAAEFASKLQNMDLDISLAVKMPAGVLGAKVDGTTEFTVNNSSVLTAYENNTDYTTQATYWMGIGQTLINAIGVKAEELANSGVGGGGTVTPTKYTVTVTNDGNGTATASPSSAAEGATVTLTATPATGYEFDEWVVVSGGVTITNNKFTMPAGNVEVKATFVEKQAVAVEHTLWIVGDSTVCEFADAYYYPRYGYGTQIGNYLDGSYEIKNLAASGRSSTSFLTDSAANYEALISGMQAGDALVIGFGHNDEKQEAARFTNPNGDHTVAGSFQKSLYDNYVKPAMDKGVEVILCTPIVRRNTSNDYSGSSAHITSTAVVGGVTYEGGDYAQAIKNLGATFNLTVIDLTGLTKDVWQTAGADEALYFHAWTSNKEGSVDNTHLNIYGAKKVAYLFANALKDTTSTLGAHVVLGTEPTKATDLVSNPSYVIKPYDNNLAQSELWADYGIFKGTAFGALGGNPSTNNYNSETTADGDLHLVTMNKKGKVTSGGDGVFMYYYKVPVGSSFSFKAKATLNSILNDKQVGFGLMARDDMYIDKNDSSILSDYVAAAASPDGATTGGFNCFYRNAGTFVRNVELTTETLEAGKSYDLSIVSNSDGYACTFGNEPTQTAGYDFMLTTIDSEYVYIGMFVARTVDVTFSDIELIVDNNIIDVMTGEVIGTVGGGSGETPTDPVEAFISRMYTVALKRAEIDADGLANWVAQLKAGVLDGAGIAQFFVLGEEFKMKGFSNEEFVDILYLTFFDREADADGKAYWVYVLEQGFSREFVLSNFVNLNEFTMICDSFGIERGLMLENGTAVNPGIPQFVKRLYLIALDRAADNDGLKNYTMALLVKAETAESVAKNFLLSEEYAMRNRTNEEFVTDLYSVFMNRTPDADGIKFWVDTMAIGMTKAEAIAEFAKSAEFKAIAAGYGLE